MASPGTRICLTCDQRMNKAQCPTCGATTVLVTGVYTLDSGLVGQRIGTAYDVTGVLGRGGMGVVYKGVQRSMGRPVAIKVIAPGGNDPVSVLRRFDREARITSRLQHPNTIRVFDSGVTQDGLMYLVMEMLEGRELSKEIKAAGHLPLQRALNVATQVLRALNESHGLGIVHRDLKPANIFLQQVTGGDVTVKVMDFGIAKMARDDDRNGVTMVGQVVGSPTYMAPEQIQTNQADARSDLYALGVILFEMLCGRPPFLGETVTAIMLKHVSEAPPDIGTLVAELQGNTRVKDVLARFLAKKPSDRPKDAAAALELLATLQGESTGNFSVAVGAGTTRARALTPTVADRSDATAVDELSQEDRALLDAAAAGTRTAQQVPPPEPDATILPPPPPVPSTGMPWAILGGSAAVVLVGGLLALFLTGRLGSTAAPAADPIPANPPSDAGRPVAEPPRPAAQWLKVTSTPSGAQVTVAGTPRGPTPVSVELPAGQDSVEVTVSKAGHESVTQTVPAQGAVDVVLKAQTTTPVREPPRKGHKKGEGNKPRMTDQQLLEDF